MRDASGGGCVPSGATREMRHVVEGGAVRQLPFPICVDRERRRHLAPTSDEILA